MNTATMIMILRTSSFYSWSCLLDSPARGRSCDLHTAQSRAISHFDPRVSIPMLTQSRHLFTGLPWRSRPFTSTSFTRGKRWSPSFLNTRPNQFSQFHTMLSSNPCSLSEPQMYSFRFLSDFVTPVAQQRILILLASSLWTVSFWSPRSLLDKVGRGELPLHRINSLVLVCCVSYYILNDTNTSLTDRLFVVDWLTVTNNIKYVGEKK